MKKTIEIPDECCEHCKCFDKCWKSPQPVKSCEVTKARDDIYTAYQDELNRDSREDLYKDEVTFTKGDIQKCADLHGISFSEAFELMRKKRNIVIKNN